MGGTGQFYGNKYTWSFAPGWESHIDTPGVAQLTIWKDFFAALPWQDLVPDQDHKVVTSGLGTVGGFKTRVSQSDYCTAAKTADGSFVVAYMPTARTITVNLASLKAPASAKWFDPTNGTYSPIPGGPVANKGTREFTPPGRTTMATETGFYCWMLRGPRPRIENTRIADKLRRASLTMGMPCMFLLSVGLRALDEGGHAVVKLLK